MMMSLIGFAIIALITYWWADSGALSALLHFVCVLIAGAIALAVWEPLAYLMLAGGAGGLAKGIVLIGVFLGSLAGLRLLSDKLVPQDLVLPRGIGMAIGGLFGFGAGVLSVGMLLVGIGHLQSTVTIGDFTGWSRRSDVPASPSIGSDDAPILHVANATVGFYSYLSWGAFTPWLGGGTLDTHAPQLVRTSASLYRDSFAEGMGRVSIQPGAVAEIELLDIARARLSGAVNAAEVPAWGVEFGVNQEGFDGNGVQFVIAASQVRLVGDGKGGAASVAHPVSWVQPNKDAALRQYYFSGATSYACSVASQGDGRFMMVFGKDALKGQQPKFVEIKGVRFKLPKAVAAASPVQEGGARKLPLVEDPDATDITSDVEFPSARYALKGIVINLNAKGGLVTDNSNYITAGEQKFPKAAASSVSADLMLKGFKVDDNERVLRLEATARNGSARLFPDLNPWITEAGAVAQSARVAVIDRNGAKYYAVGFVYDDGEYVQVKSTGGAALTLKGIPVQAIGSASQLTLYFRVPAETEFVGLVLATGKEDRLVNKMSATSPKIE
jgi:hypothetical protein